MKLLSILISENTSMRILTLILMTLLLSACGASHDKMGEALLFNSDRLKIKVVQIYDDIPLSYYGLTHQLWCRSPRTMDMAWGGMEKGWNDLAKSGVGEPGQSPSKAVQKRALEAAVMDANKHLQVISDEVIVFESHGILKMTIDGCESFSTWNGWYLPEDMVVQAEKQNYCKDVKCQWENFKGDNEISYFDIQVDTKSRKISFLAHSKAFKDGELSVQSVDGGKHWAVTKGRHK